MPKGYLVGHFDVTDFETYKSYTAQAPGIIEKYGGKYLVRGGDFEPIEDQMPGSRTIVLEFDSLAQARTFYNSEEYQNIVGIRHSVATGAAILVEGT